MKNLFTLLLLFCINNAKAQTNYEIIEAYGNDSVLVKMKLEGEQSFCRGILVKEIKQGNFDYYMGERRVGTIKYSNDSVVAMTEYHENGNIKSYDEYKNDVLHGASLRYYPDNRIKTRGSHQNDLRNGNWKLWDENGMLISETDYKDNLGYCKIYSENGKVAREGNVYFNHEYGLWTVYKKNGKIYGYTDYDSLEAVIAFHYGE